MLRVNRGKHNKAVPITNKILSNENKNSVSYEQIKNVRSSIQFASMNKVKTIIVTSSESGAGKSFISTNLSLSYAEQESKVLLIDTDLRRPTIHKIFNKNNSIGITNILVGENSIEECVQPTRFENLSILTSGFLPPNPAELLGSEEMKVIINQLAREFDIVIFDTPPVLPVVDTTLFSSLVDGVVFVVRSDYTDQSTAMKAVEKLRFARSRIIGAVLNGKDSKDSGYYGEYY